MKTNKILLPPTLKFRWAGVLFFLLLINESSFSQTIYEVEPGTKGNEIKLTIANVSETNQATNVTVRPHPTLSKGEGFQEEIITFHQLEQTIDILNPKEEKEVTSHLM